MGLVRIFIFLIIAMVYLMVLNSGCGSLSEHVQSKPEPTDTYIPKEVSKQAIPATDIVGPLERYIRLRHKNKSDLDFQNKNDRQIRERLFFIRDTLTKHGISKIKGTGRMELNFSRLAADFPNNALGSVLASVAEGERDIVIDVEQVFRKTEGHYTYFMSEPVPTQDLSQFTLKVMMTHPSGAVLFQGDTTVTIEHPFSDYEADEIIISHLIEKCVEKVAQINMEDEKLKVRSVAENKGELTTIESQTKETDAKKEDEKTFTEFLTQHAEKEVAIEQQDGVQLALQFVPQDLTTYKVTIEAEDSIQFEGPLLDDPDLNSKSYQRNNNRTEIIITSQIKSIDDEGNAIVNIIIKGLKCLVIYQNNSVLDFDSSQEKDRNNPLNRLIGQNYTIKIAPTGEVVKVIDANEARIAIGSDLTSMQRALILISEDAIKARHTIQALPPDTRNRLHIGDRWSRISTFSFRQMGSKSYEKIYTLKEIKNSNNQRLAIIGMNAIPSAETAQELHKKQAISPFSNLFDNVETYTGELRFDLTTGKVEQYSEELQTEWIMADLKTKNNKEPSVIRMKAVRSYILEQVNQ